MKYKPVYDIENKERNIKDYIDYFLTRSIRFFEYENLPDTIPANMLEKYLQTIGVVFIVKDNDKPYAIFGGWGGEPDAYYRGTKATLANPALNISREYTIGEDCVLLRNTSMYKGLLELYSRYATLMTETDISMTISTIMSRVSSIISTADDRTKASAELFIKNIKDGKMSVVTESPFFEALKTLPYNDTAHSEITDLIELTQYLRASLYNELGLSANYNMKREAINSSEANLGLESMFTLVYDMLLCRQEDFAQVNKLFGTDIKVSLGLLHEQAFNKLLGNNTETGSIMEGEGVTITDIKEPKEESVEVVEDVKEEPVETTEDVVETPEETKVIEVPVTDEDVENATGDDVMGETEQVEEPKEETVEDFEEATEEDIKRLAEIINGGKQ